MQRIPLTLMFLTLIGLSCLTAQNTQSTFIYFQSDESNLDQEDHHQLNGLLSELESHSTYQIDIIGHTDQDGSDGYNEQLADKRAQQTYDYLIGLGAPESVLSQKAMGERALVSSDLTKDAKQKNRRVELQYRFQDFETIDDLTQQISETEAPIQNFTVTEGNQLIDLEHGASIYVPKDAFVYADGSLVTGEVDIEVIEAYKMTDFMAHGLITQSHGEMLETGGMLYVNATAGGEPVQIAENRSIEIIYPVQQVEDGMELFYAEESEDGIVWTPTETELRTTQVKNDPIMIDLDEIANYDFGRVEKPILQFEDMPDRPTYGDMPFPPSAKLYSPERYKELYANYEKNLDTWHHRKPFYEEELRQWNKEVDHRLDEINDYRNTLLETKYKIKLITALKGLDKMKGRRAPAELIKRIFSFINKPMQINVDDRAMYLEAFGNHTRGLISERNLTINNLGYKVYPKNSEFYTDIRKLIFEAEKRVLEKRIAEGGTIDRKNFSSYIANISQLGWINCDRFLRSGKELTDITVERTPEGTKVYIIYKNIRSFLTKTSRSNEVTFKSSPIGEPAKLIAVKLMNGKPQMAVRDITIEADQYVSLDFFPAQLTDVRAELNAVDPILNNNRTQPSYDLSLKVFPNPTTEIFTADISPIDKLNELAIYDLSGQLMKTVDTSNTRQGISVSDFSNGTYVVSAVFENGQRATERVVIQN